MNTSYFNKTHPIYGRMIKHPDAVSIARWNRWYKGRRYPALVPPDPVLRAYLKDHDETRYVEAYQAQVLDRLDHAQVYQDLGENAILLCHCGPGKFCHRRLVAAWLESALGIEIPEA
jgi:hypothetical protein